MKETEKGLNTPPMTSSTFSSSFFSFSHLLHLNSKAVGAELRKEACQSL